MPGEKTTGFQAPNPGVNPFGTGHYDKCNFPLSKPKRALGLVETASNTPKIARFPLTKVCFLCRDERTLNRVKSEDGKSSIEKREGLAFRPGVEI